MCSIDAQQMQIFLAMVLCGTALGAVYDALEWIRKCVLKRHKPGIFDGLLFGVLCAGGIVFTALALRIDAFRWYTLLGAGAGMGLYAVTVGRILWALQSFGRYVREKLAEENGI